MKFLSAILGLLLLSVVQPGFAVLEQPRAVTLVAELNEKIKKIVVKNSRINLEILTLESSLDELNEQIQNLEGEIQVTKNSLRRRLQFSNRSSGQLLLKSVVEATDLQAIQRYSFILARMTKIDLQRMQDIRSLNQSILDKRDKLSERILVLRDRKSELESMEKSLNLEISRKLSLIEKIKQSKSINQVRLQELKKQALSEKNLVGSEIYELLIKPSFYENFGKLLSPVDGAVVKQGFGVWRDDVFKLKLFHPGMFFETEANAPVRAVSSGEIVFAGPVDGHGETVILDHGESYYTVYSHLKINKLKIGDYLDKGQILGFVGTPSLVFGRGVYFEIRHFNEAQNPQKWLAKSMNRNLVKSIE